MSIYDHLDGARPAVIAGVREGDTLVIAIAHHVDEDEFDRLMTGLKEELSGVNIVILSSVSDIAILRKS